MQEDGLGSKDQIWVSDLPPFETFPNRVSSSSRVKLTDLGDCCLIH